MQVIQSKHPSDLEYRVLKITDTSNMRSLTYAVAVDIFDERNKEILKSFLSVISAQDKVMLFTFGLHTDVTEINPMQQYWEDKSVRDLVDEMLSRKEKGLNTLVAARALECISANHHILITAGCHDICPSGFKTSLNDLVVFSPQEKHFLWAHVVYSIPHKGPSQRIIRDVLCLSPPRYHDIKIHSRGIVNAPTPPRGGTRTVLLDSFNASFDQLSVSYMLSDGTIVETKCKLEDDDSIPFISDFMKPCAMVE